MIEAEDEGGEVFGPPRNADDENLLDESAWEDEDAEEELEDMVKS